MGKVTSQELKTMGAGSLIDADKVDGYDVSATAGAANTIVLRNASGYIMNNWFNSNRADEATAAASYLYDSGDGYMRKKTLANARAEICSPYLPLAGGTMTGDLIMPSASTTYGMKVLATAGGWARGYNAFNAAGTTQLGGIGVLGSADTITSMYMGFGTTPYSNPMLEVTSTGANIRGNTVISGGTLNAGGLGAGYGDEVWSNTASDAVWINYRSGSGLCVGNGTQNSTTGFGKIICSYIDTRSSGSGTNVKVGDDCWIGDCNMSNTIRISGVQNAAQGFIKFGSGATSTNGYIGTSGSDTSIDIVGETHMWNSSLIGYSDPWSGVGCTIKAAGDSAFGNNIKVGNYVYATGWNRPSDNRWGVVATNIDRLAHYSTPYVEYVVPGVGTFGITSWASDISLKENIQYVTESSLDKLVQIKHRSFDWISGGSVSMGYVSQELKAIDKNFVTPIEQEDGTLWYQPNETVLIPHITKAIQELKAIIDGQAQQIQELKNKLEAI